MDIQEFIDQLADGDSNDHEIECLRAALKEASYLLDELGLDKLEGLLPGILQEGYA